MIFTIYIIQISPALLDSPPFLDQDADQKCFLPPFVNQRALPLQQIQRAFVVLSSANAIGQSRCIHLSVSGWTAGLSTLQGLKMNGHTVAFFLANSNP